jgi:hypothetical protein
MDMCGHLDLLFYLFRYYPKATILVEDEEDKDFDWALAIWAKEQLQQMLSHDTN